MTSSVCLSVCRQHRRFTSIRQRAALNFLTSHSSSDLHCMHWLKINEHIKYKLRVRIVGGMGVEPPVHVYRCSFFEWKSALNFNPWAKFQTFRHLSWLLGQFPHCITQSLIYKVFTTSQIYTTRSLFSLPIEPAPRPLLPLLDHPYLRYYKSSTVLLDMDQLKCGISSRLHSVTLFTVLPVHLI